MARAAPAALPRDESAFFGRTAELAGVERRLAAGARLVTIVGLPGVGKSRLAVAAAEAHGSAALYASLAESRGLESSVRAVARAVGVRLASESRAGAAVRAVSDALAARGDVLLVLDQAEPRTTLAKELVDGLLERAPALRVVATSREPLGVRGEEKVLLGPLSAEDARALLADRARVAAGREVVLDDATALAIVDKLDRLPLAVEVAAARLDVLTAAELVARLGPIASMRASLEASFALLSPEEQRALAQVSVFAGPFDVDTAEQLVALGEGAKGDVVDALSALVQRSLLVRADEGGSRARLRMFETVRAWARTKLDELGLADATVERHVTIHLAQAERWAKRTYGEGGARALDALAELLPELLVAFERTRSGAPEAAARIVLALTDLLLFRGLLDLRAELFEAGVEAAERAGSDALLARALAIKARVDLELGRMEAAETGLGRAVALATKAGEETTRLEATRTMGWLLVARGMAAEAEATLRDVREEHRGRGEARGQADASAALGVLHALTGRRAEALAELQSALGLHVAAGDALRQEKVLGFGALAGFDAKELARGLPREVLQRAPARSIASLPAQVADMVATEAEAGRRWHEALDAYLSGAAAEARGDVEGAIGAFERAIVSLRASGMTRGAAAVHAHAAVAFASAGDHAEADARLRLAREAAGDGAVEGRVVDAFAAAVALTRARAGRDAAESGRAVASAREELDRADLVEGAPPELVAARAVLVRLLGDGRELVEPPPPSIGPRAAGLVVGPESRWIVLGAGARVDLVRYGPVRRLLDRLVDARLERPGEALSAETLIEAGWPGERMRHTAGLLRVYSGIRRLRRMGLEDLLVTRDDGYLLDPSARIRREPG